MNAKLIAGMALVGGVLFAGHAAALGLDLPGVALKASPLTLDASVLDLRVRIGAEEAEASMPIDEGVGTMSAVQQAAAPVTWGASAAGQGVAMAAGIAAVALALEPVRYGLGAMALPLYSRIRRNDLLENGVRDRIFQIVQAHPGLTIQELTTEAGVGWGTTVYHLTRLERDRLVVSRKFGFNRRFFGNGASPQEHHEAISVLRNDVSKRIAGFLLENPGAAQKDVCEALEISAPVASKYLRRMQEASLLSSEREWKRVKYYPRPHLGEIVRITTPTLAEPAGTKALATFAAGAEPAALELPEPQPDAAAA